MARNEQYYRLDCTNALPECAFVSQNIAPLGMGASMSKGGPGVLQISWAMKSAGDFLGDFTYNRPAHVTGHQSGGTSNRDLTCIRRDTGGL